MALTELFVLLFSASVLLSVSASTGSIEHEAVKDAEWRTEQTLKGLFHYFWKEDPSHKKIKFFFTCAQLGRIGSNRAGKCSCSNPSSCVNCYRWWSAVALESVATYGIYMNTTNHSTTPDTFYKHSPYNDDWNATSFCTYIDDFLWYGIAYLRVYDWLGEEKWLNRSISLLDWAYEYGWDQPCGGFWWSNCGGRKFKDNIELVQAMHLAAKLAYLLPNQTRFLNSAEKIWSWFFSYNNGRGLMSDTNLVSTGVVPEECCNSSSNPEPYKQCHNTRLSGTAYNHGLFLTSAAYLYLRTGNQTYLKIGIRSVEAIIANYTTKEGLLIDEPRSYQAYYYSCYAGSDPGGDWYSFNGIFMAHLGYFTELLVKNESMPSDTLERINVLMQKTSDSAWSKSSVRPPFDASNVCHLGSSAIGVDYPKFHWWWGSEEVSQIIPPDPRIYFHKTQLRCVSVGNDTQIWEGYVLTEDDCKSICSKNVNCSKYLWKVYQDVVGVNCWIWSYSRSDHVCNQSDYNWNVGAKRPDGHATCAGKCGSSDPQKLDQGVCYCDSNCTEHLDCCLDYADHCRPKQPLSCKGLCNTLTAQPIPGGGYCWCNSGCNAWFTDNNSDASCCPDYPQECSKIVIPQCLDARSHGSALNLFLGHVSVARMHQIKKTS